MNLHYGKLKYSTLQIRVPNTGENVLPNGRMQHPGNITVSQGRITLGAKLQG